MSKKVLIIGRDPIPWVNKFIDKYKNKYVSADSDHMNMNLHTTDGVIDLVIYVRKNNSPHVHRSDVDMVVILHDEWYNTPISESPYCVVYTSENKNMVSIDDHMVVEHSSHNGLLVFTWIARQCLSPKTALREIWCAIL
jgi:hypothetical protein